jgi:hypothetical protein
MASAVRPGGTVVEVAVSSPPVLVEAPPRLEAVLRAGTDRVCTGLPFALVLTVSNTGEASATSLVFGVPLDRGGLSVSVLAEPGPVPPLAGGEGATLEWRVVLPGPGEASFTLTVAGADANEGGEVSVRVCSGPVRVLRPGRLEAALSAREEASVGQWMTIAMSVTNTGEAGVAVAAPSAWTRSGTGSFIRRYPGPEPFDLEPGGSRLVVWTWSVAGRGEVDFAGEVSGTSCGCLATGASAGATMAAVNPAELSADIRVSSTEAIIGQWIRVVLTVTNEGEAAARGVRPEPLETGPAVLRVAGPEPRMSRALPGGASTRFEWSYSVSGEAVIHFAGGARARDANSGYPATAPLLASPKVDLLRPALLELVSLKLMPDPAYEPGAIVTAILVVANKGGASAQVTEVSVSEKSTKGTALVRKSLASLGLPKWVKGGDVVPLIWTYRGGEMGHVTVTAVVTGKETATGRKFKSASLRSNEVSVRGTPPDKKPTQ